jgi:nucleotide sugar dehydrogenase
VVVVGLGYVGLPLALLAREKGWGVSGVDIDPRKREQIRTASVPDLDPGHAASLRREPFFATDSFEKVRDADIVIICVPTPVDRSFEPDLEPVKQAAEGVGKFLEHNTLVILESTVHPGTAEEVVIPLLERASGLRAGHDFGFAHCPERVNPGDPYWSVERIPRVVGATTGDALIRAADFYRSILSAPVREMASIREAEAVKMTENCFRDINIAFVNELAMSFSKLGIDIEHVLDGAATKPFGFMRHAPGTGVGGHCIPVDPYYLIRYARKNGFTHRFLSLARSINNEMPAFTVALLESALAKEKRSLPGATVALLGLSYKPNVSDLRESPAFEIRHILEARGATVRAYEPHAVSAGDAGTLSEALQGADAAVVATAHREFMELSPEDFADHGVDVVIDGRNCLPKEEFLEAGIAYRGIGR